jgi:hypothetical protein
MSISRQAESPVSEKGIKEIKNNLENRIDTKYDTTYNVSGRSDQ